MCEQNMKDILSFIILFIHVNSMLNQQFNNFDEIFFFI